MQCIPLHQGCCQPGRCPADGLAGLWGLTVKAQCLSACLPSRHPDSLCLSYQPRVVGIDFAKPLRVVPKRLQCCSLFTSAKYLARLKKCALAFSILFMLFWLSCANTDPSYAAVYLRILVLWHGRTPFCIKGKDLGHCHRDVSQEFN